MLRLLLTRGPEEGEGALYTLFVNTLKNFIALEKYLIDIATKVCAFLRNLSLDIYCYKINCFNNNF